MLTKTAEKKNKILALLLLIIPATFLFFSPETPALSAAGAVDHPPCRIALSNIGNGEVIVNLLYSDNGQKTWNPATVEPKDTTCWNSQEIVVRLATARVDNSIKEVRYLLLAGKRYKVYWNRRDTTWDIVEVTPRR